MRKVLCRTASDATTDSETEAPPGGRTSASRAQPPGSAEAAGATSSAEGPDPETCALTFDQSYALHALVPQAES
jgi:hypothetical protein